MDVKRLHESDGLRSFAVVLSTGDEAMACLERFAGDHAITAAQITGIGALEKAVLKYFDWEIKDYCSIPVDEQVEVASLIGDIARDADDKVSVHIHLVLGKRDGAAVAGHLSTGKVRPTLELIVHEAPAHLRKRYDPETGLSLIDLD
jgi:uncharacterized protein